MYNLIHSLRQSTWKAASFFLKGVWALRGRCLPAAMMQQLSEPLLGLGGQQESPEGRNRFQPAIRNSGAGRQQCTLDQPCRGQEPLLLNLHFSLADKMLKVNGEITLGMFGSLELPWLPGNQWLWRAKTQARKILDLSTTKPISTWRAIILLFHELGCRSLWLPVGWMLSSKCSAWWAAEGRGYAKRCRTFPSSDPAQHSTMCSLQLEHAARILHPQLNPKGLDGSWTQQIRDSSQLCQWDLCRAKHIGLGSSCVRMIRIWNRKADFIFHRTLALSVAPLVSSCYEFSNAWDFGSFQAQCLLGTKDFIYALHERVVCTFSWAWHAWRNIRLGKSFSSLFQTDNFIPCNLKKLCSVSVEGWEQGSRHFWNPNPYFDLQHNYYRIANKNTKH